LLNQIEINNSTKSIILQSSDQVSRL
jgi:hypothetical protein